MTVVCECGRCWTADRSNDRRPWPTIAPTRTWAEGTIRVAIPCRVALPPYTFPPGLVVESECEFYGHTLAEAHDKARRHLARGVDCCRVAAEHGDALILPAGVDDVCDLAQGRHVMPHRNCPLR